MAKNVIFWIGVRSDDPLLKEKHGDFKYLDISKKCWEWWCNKNDIVFYEYTTPKDPNTGENKVTWQRWFDVFDQLDSNNIDYDKIALVDGSSMIRWDTPNFFNLVNNKPIAFRSLENLKWVYQGVQGYKTLFDNFDFDITKYNSCGFQIFDKSHKSFLDTLKEFYYKNYNEILSLQKTVSRGTDQPVYNYLSQIHNIEFDTISPAYMLTHLNRFDWLSHNWQLKEDTTPFFIKYSYIWFFSGFDRRQRQPLMQQTWDIIKRNYE
jgi:hypothetical protein